MDSKTLVHRASTAASRSIAGQVAIISTDVNRIRLLNAVGGFIWERCEGRTLEAITDAVCQEFGVDRATAARDVESFVVDLAGRGMLTTGEASQGAAPGRSEG